MSTAALKPCRNPRCAALAVPGRAWCEAHLPAARAQFVAERVAKDDRRGSSASRGYGSRWRGESQAFRAQHPICGGALVATANYDRARAVEYHLIRESMALAGRAITFLGGRGAWLIVHPIYRLVGSRADGDARLGMGNACSNPAVLTDHIVPHRGDPELLWSAWNWQTLCKACHDKKTASHDGGFRGAGAPLVQPKMEAGIL